MVNIDRERGLHVSAAFFRHDFRVFPIVRTQDGWTKSGTDERPMRARGETSAQGARAFRSAAKPLTAIAICLLVANCASSQKFARNVDPKYGVATSPRVVEPGQPVPKGGGTYRVGKPYTVAGRVYTPEEDADYRAEGLASWYGDDFHGRLTANGEVFDMNSISAAHPTLPIPSYVRVTNLANRRSIIVRVNDRGPYHGNRIIDVSHRTADLLGFKGNGIARVRVEYVGRASLEGSDDRKLVATLRTEPATSRSLVQVASAGPMLDLPGETRRVRRLAEGPVPVPAERPYALGQYDTARNESARIALRTAPTDVTASSWTLSEPRTAPHVTAFADPGVKPVAFVTARGLY
jgi:rare lipoprotein A